MPKALRWLLATLILAAGIIGVERYLGWAALLSAWRELPLSHLLGLTALTLCSYILRAFRVYRYFIDYTSGAFSQTLRLSLLHNAINNFLPMRLGEASFPILMKRQFSVSLSQSTSGLLWIRLADLHCLSTLFLLSLAPNLGPMLFVLAGLWLLLPRALWLIWQRGTLHLPPKWQSKIATLQQFSPTSFRQWQRMYGLTTLVWLSKLFALCAIMLSFISIPPAQALLAVIGADFSSVLPIHGLAGSGTYEAAMLVALSPFDLPSKDILAAAVNVHLYLLGTSLLSIPLALLISERARNTLVTNN
ncbi:flippase-like domain-containing protein [Spongiibacter sp. KMU-158]|uniref:Flippase-like domain-containing protein n=1 Tax=Spongiibacter pelagi TaxID=2760804 RepID=A0A927GW38_9GAMM|nr:lysylphosphatidylglycerol synthase transmembrane domain-containing protein [Spongiibacter pelagi]MBD2858542.1 flippase-like domain-containing protein [Spongiibacter pelagi]